LLKDVLLDLVEVHIRDQYFSRRDLVEFSKMGHISELWRKGERNSCGYVSNQTKVVFRSTTAVFHLFVQMSNEMWNFDEFGDLYFEKAVKFLRELFLKLWTVRNSQTSRVIRFFIEILFAFIFHRVLVQNERFTPEEWRRTLTHLLMEFRIFQSELRQYILSSLEDIKYPQDVSLQLPPAREGNFLEALNLTLTLYEEYNIDRNFDRTGKVCVIVTPGSGVFDASRDLISLSKQRSLDLGVTVNLVCLGMQPLHAVPLFVVSFLSRFWCHQFAHRFFKL
uniref:DEP domain-containing protein n=1 Tax=Schistocephalus solidus TaxID=70667 RepID=A0A183T7P0_SCHSO